MATATASASSPSAAASAVRAHGSTVTSSDERAEHTGRRTVGQQRAGAVPPGQPDRERVDPGPPVRPLLLRRALPGHQLGDPPAGRLVRLDRPDAALLQLAQHRRVQLADLVAGRGQLGLGDAGPILRLGQRLGQPLDLLGGGRRPAAQRLGPAGQGGQPGPAVGQRAHRGQVRPLGRGQPALGARCAPR